MESYGWIIWYFFVPKKNKNIWQDVTRAFFDVTKYFVTRIAWLAGWRMIFLTKNYSVRRKATNCVAFNIQDMLILFRFFLLKVFPFPLSTIICCPLSWDTTHVRIQKYSKLPLEFLVLKLLSFIEKYTLLRTSRSTPGPPFRLLET